MTCLKSYMEYKSFLITIEYWYCYHGNKVLKVLVDIYDPKKQVWQHDFYQIHYSERDTQNSVLLNLIIFRLSTYK